jgi:ATP-binding cassette subfamily C protein
MATVSASAPVPTGLYGSREFLPGRTGRASGRGAGTARLLLAQFVSFAGRRRLAIAAGLILAGTTLEGVGILLIVPLLQLFFEPGANEGLAGRAPFDWMLEPFGPAAQYSLLLAGFVVLMLLRAVVLVVRDTQLARLQWGFIGVIKLGLFDRLASASWKEVMAIDRPRLNRALGGDMVQVGLAVNAAMQTAAAALMLAAYCMFAFALAPKLSLLTFGVLAGVGLAGAIFVRRAGAFGRAALGYDLRMEESASQFLSGLKLAKAQELQEGFVASYAAASNAAVDTRVAFVRTMSMSRQSAVLFGAMAAGTAVLVAILASDTHPALLVTSVVLLSRTAGPVSQIQQGVQQVANALPIFAELQDLVGHLPEGCSDRPVEAQARGTGRAACSISFETVSVTHCTGEGEPQGGLRSIEFEVAPGEFIGLSGFTGSGKSTLLDLVAGLEKPDAGKVLFDGRELFEAELTAYRRRLAYLAADPVLFAGTVRSNLSWAAPNAGDEAMWEALEAATATEIIARLGGGLDSRIHDAGANLSGGERQQIAIARALLRNPSLLLLDEATSSLDREREQRVLAKLATRNPRPTILFVSHREESFAQCDRVVALSEGKIHSIRRIA